MSDSKPRLYLVSNRPSESKPEETQGTVREIFGRLLKAKLTPTLTVEDASHLDLPFITDEDKLPSVDDIFETIRLLERAGLGVRMWSEEIPEGIVLVDEDLFRAKFPELAAAIPLLKAYEGVQPYSGGVPRRLQRLTVLPEQE